MGEVAEAVKKVARDKERFGSEFAEQLERYKKFKKAMNDAGVEYGDKYEIPLMTRLGQVVKPK